MMRRLSPGTTSARMRRSVSTSLGIISRSATARSRGKRRYLCTEATAIQQLMLQSASSEGVCEVLLGHRQQVCNCAQPGEKQVPARQSAR